MPSSRSMRAPTIPSFDVLSVLGEGGMGAVFLALQREPIERQVAIKVIRPGWVDDTMLRRFEFERRTLARMDHPGITTVLDAGWTEEGAPYFVMEYVPGEPIAQFCDAGHFTVRQRLELFLEVCDAVQHAHRRGVLHRDIKPGNVLVRWQEGRPFSKIIDFGLARAQHADESTSLLTRIGGAIGTPAFMSPEQAGVLHRDVDTRADVYSLGILLYRLLVGALPYKDAVYRDSGPGGWLAALQREAPSMGRRLGEEGVAANEIAVRRSTSVRTLRSTLQGELSWVVSRAIEPERSRRYESVSDFAEDVRSWLGQRPVAAARPSQRYRLRKWAARHRGLVAAGAAACLLAAGGVAATAQQAVRAMRAEQDAVALADSERVLREEAEAAKRNALTARDRAESHASRRQAVSDFLVDLLEQADPHRRGRDLRVVDVLDDAAKGLDQRFEDQPDVRVELHKTLSTVFRGLGEAERALGHSTRGLELLRSVGEMDGLDVADFLNVHAVGLRRVGRSQESEPFYREALALLEASTVARAADLRAIVRFNLAMLFESTGRAAEALPLARATYEQHVASRAHDVQAVSIAGAGLARVLEALGRFDEARALYDDLVERFRSIQGDRPRPQLATLISSQAKLELRIGNEDEALQRLEECIGIAEAALGDDHPDCLTYRTNYANGLRKVGLPDEAAAVLEDALAARPPLKNDGTHGRLAACLGYALALVSLEEFEGAESTANDAWVLAQRLVRPVEETYVAACCLLARCHLEAGRTSQAETLVRELARPLPQGQRTLHSHIEIEQIRRRLFTAQGRDEEAREASQRLARLLSEERTVRTGSNG